MNKAVLVQCTNSKRDDPAAAKDLYDESNYYCKMREYAEAHGEPWFILSAKHGLVDPNTVLEPYDEFGLDEEQCERIAWNLDERGYDTVEVIAGKKYINPLTPALEARGIEVIEKCRGLGIGERMERLDTLTKRVKNESVCSK